MRLAVLATCLLAGAVAVYPESPTAGASRSTSLPQSASALGQRSFISEDEIDAWVRTWQRRLGLADWKIETRIVRLNQLPKGTVANIHWSLPRKTATIRVVHPMDSNLSKLDFIRDTELSVVHELIHLSMAKLPLDSTDTDLEEETVKRISTALLSLEKGDEQQER